MKSYENCACGKKGIFNSKEAAWGFLNRHKEYTHLANVTPCSQDPSIWHVTSKVNSSRTKLSLLERELHAEMATVKEQVVEYIRDKYDTTGEYKCTTSEIRKEFEKRGIFNVSVAISALRKAGVITDLDEKDPTRKGPPSYKFALTEILDDVTNPKKKDTKPVANDKPAPTPVNPFDKVTDQLNLILTQLQGLSTGYSDLVRAMPNKEFIASLKSAGEPIDYERIANAVNHRLGDLTKDDAFVYRVREELDDRIHKLEDLVRNIKVPSSVANPNDYREGLKEGIRLASEMGLQVKSE